jgi:hypothetical protein
VACRGEFNVVSERAARLAVVIVAALALRPAHGQQFPPGAGAPPPQFPQQAAYNLPPPAPMPPPAEVFKPAQIMAIVGDRYIFYGDIAPTIEMMIDSALVKAKTEADRQNILRQRDQLVAPTLQRYIETKMMYLAFDREFRKNAKDKYDEIRGQMEKRVRVAFDDQIQRFRELVKTARPEDIGIMLRQSPVAGRVALLMNDHGLESMAEVDARLRTMGTTLDLQYMQFVEHILGRDMANRQIKAKHEVTHQEMLDYYEQHAADYGVTAKARFEILTAKTANFGGDRVAARNAVAAMGNDVFHGTPFPAVAQRSSQEPNARIGGQYDWVSQGSLASQPIDEALFSIEPGKLSAIIEDDAGFHIIRVHERTPTGMVSFVEAQPKIKEAIEQQKREADYKEFIEELQRSTTVWTIFDGQAGGQ